MPDGTAAHNRGGRRPYSLPVAASGLCLEVRGRKLIDSTDLTLEPGGRTAILGPNGAGKSLLLRLLHGLIEPTNGTVRWNGRPMDDGVRMRQAMVFQRPVLLRRSVAANLRYALRRKHGRFARLGRRTAEWLARAELTGLSERPARLLSGGEQQRLAVACALCRQPEILFLDEPTSSLDPAATLAIERLLAIAHAEGTKIVLVTHDRGQAQRLADEVLFMHHGRILERAAASSFFAQPSSDAARRYLAGQIVL